MGSPEELVQRVLACRTLPMIPGTPVQILQLAQNPDVSVPAIVKVMGTDPVLAARVLKVANRSVPHDVPSLAKAIAILGMRRVSTLALGVSLSAMFHREQSAGAALEDIWRRSLYSGLAARVLSTETRAGLDDEAFLGGLFQDIGMLGMLAAVGDEYEALLHTRKDHERLVDVEQFAVGTDHAQVGAAMAEHWRLPRQLIDSIAYHHSPAAGAEDIRPVSHLVWASRVVANVLLAEATDSAACGARDVLRDHFGFDDARIQGLLEQLAGEAEQFADLFDVQTLSECEMARVLAQAQEALLQAALDADAEAQHLREVNHELVETAGRDRLTGLQNRTRLEEVMGELFDRAAGNGQQIAALFVDADHFKSINDVYGHAVGDDVLRRLGRIILDTCGDSAFRFGGEEIVCLLVGDDAAGALDTAERIRQAAADEEINGGDHVVRITVSIGVATRNDGNRTTVEELIAAADQALYAAKREGRNRVCTSRPVPAW